MPCCSYINEKELLAAAAAAAKSLQSCPTLCDPIDGSPSGSPIPGILQARTLEWVAISLSNAWKWKVKVKSLSRAWLFATPCSAAYQGPLPMGFSRQECWSGVPLPSPRNCLLTLKTYHGSPWYWKTTQKVQPGLIVISTKHSQKTEFQSYILWYWSLSQEVKYLESNSLC